MPVVLTNPVRSPISVPEEASRDFAPEPASAPRGVEDAGEAPADDAVTGIRPRRRRTRKTEAAADAPALLAGENPPD